MVGLKKYALFIFFCSILIENSYANLIFEKCLDTYIESGLQDPKSSVIPPVCEAYNDSIHSPPCEESTKSTYKLCLVLSELSHVLYKKNPEPKVCDWIQLQFDTRKKNFPVLLCKKILEKEQCHFSSKVESRHCDLSIENLGSSLDLGCQCMHFEILKKFFLPQISTYRKRWMSTDLHWRKIASKEGVDVFRKDEPGHRVPAFKGIGIIRVKMAVVASIIEDTTRSNEWVEHLVETKVLSQKSELDKITYSLFKSPIPLLAQDRDLVQHLTVGLDDAKTRLVFRGVSIVDPRYPAKESPVRAENILTEFILEPADEGKATAITISTEMDAKGTIPEWLAVSIQQDWPVNTIRRLRKQSQKEDIRIPRYLQLLVEQCQNSQTEL